MPDEPTQDSLPLEPVEDTQKPEEPAVEPEPEKPAEPTAVELAADLQASRERIAHLEGALLAHPPNAEPAKAEPKVYTRIELQKQVDEGNISEADRDDIIITQAKDEVRREVLAEVDKRLTTTQNASKMQTDMTAYKEAYPDVMKEGSDLRNRVKAEITALSAINGTPADDDALFRMELSALRSVLGPPSKMREKTREVRTTHQETGGSAPDTTSKADVDKAPKGLPERIKTFYQQKIDRGIYKGWNDPDVKKELEHVRH